MNHCGTQTIETERLILRRFEITDAEDMYLNWASSAAVVKYLTWPTHENSDATKALLEVCVKSYKEDNYYLWAIVLKEIDEPIGSISAVGMKESIDMIHIGYCMGNGVHNEFSGWDSYYQ